MAEAAVTVSPVPSTGTINLSGGRAAPAVENAPSKSPIDDSFKEMDQLFGTETEPAKPDPKPKVQEPVKKPEVKDTKTQFDKVEDLAKKPEQKKEEPKPDDKAKQPPRAAELRTAYEELKKKHVALQAEHEKVKATPSEDPEKKTLTERLTAAEKRVQEYEEKLRFKAYEESEEFNTKYRKPYQDAWKRAAADLEDILIEWTDAEGNPKSRKATIDDLNYIVHQKSLADAKKTAKQLFGDVAEEMMRHRADILRTSRDQQNALDEAKKNSGTWEQQQKEQQTQALLKRTQMFQDMVKAAQEKYSEWFKPVEGDEEGNKRLEEDYAKVARIFDAEAKMNPMEQLRLHSWLYNSAAGFRRQVHANKALKARVAELEGELAQFKESEPGAGDGGRETNGASTEPSMDALEKQIEALAQ